MTPPRRTLAATYALMDELTGRGTLAIGEQEIDRMFARAGRRRDPRLARAGVYIDTARTAGDAAGEDPPALVELERQAAAGEQRKLEPARELRAEDDLEYAEFCRREAEQEENQQPI